MDNKTIGLLISTRRKEKGLTQKALAEQLNVTDKAVSKWERDIAKPDINTIPKLAEILDLSLEELMNLPVKPKVESSSEPETPVVDPSSSEKSDAVAPESDEMERVAYREKAKKLLIKGAFGFCAGFTFALITSRELGFGFATLIGFFLAGVPYGWELVGRLLGNWVVVGHIAIMIIVFVIRFAVSLFISWLAYPIALAYNLMKSQKVGSTSRRILTAVWIIVVILVVVFALLLTQPWA